MTNFTDNIYAKCIQLTVNTVNKIIQFHQEPSPPLRKSLPIESSTTSTNENGRPWPTGFASNPKQTFPTLNKTVLQKYPCKDHGLESTLSSIKTKCRMNHNTTHHLWLNWEQWEILHQALDQTDGCMAVETCVVCKPARRCCCHRCITTSRLTVLSMKMSSSRKQKPTGT